jgi:hypothetical protein
MNLSNLLATLILATNSIPALAGTQAGRQDLSIDDQVRKEFTWVENEEHIADIKELAKAGLPKIRSNSRECNAPFVDLIGIGTSSQLCLKWTKLPEQLMKDLVLNNGNRFTNESDYDQRVTKFYAFEHDGELNRDLTDADIERLFKTFSASISFKSKYDTHHVEFTDADDQNYLTSVSGLFVGTTFQDQPETFRFARDFFEGAAVKSISIPYEVSLYPGGGFTTKFELLISDRHLIFVKTEGWNS